MVYTNRPEVIVKMCRNFFIAAVLVPLVSFLLFKFQDGDFILMIYEKIGQDPAVALRGKVAGVDYWRFERYR